MKKEATIIDIGFTNKDGSGSVYIVSGDDYNTIVQAGYVPISVLQDKSIDYTQYNVFTVQWYDGSNSHINLFQPVLDISGDITLASYF